MERKVSKLGLLTMSIGGMVGWGAFMQPGLKFLPQAGVLNTVIAMFIGLIMVSTIASCYGIILNKSPNSTGGEYSYSKLAFNRKHSFVVGWFLLIVFIGIAALNATSFALIFKNVLFPDTNFITLYTIAGSPVTLGEALISVAVVLVFSWFMIKGVNAVIKVQNVVTIALIIIVVSIFFLALNKIDFANSPLITYSNPATINLSGIIAILVITPWAYYGVSSIPKVASDAKLPYKQVISITVLSLVCGFFIYSMLLVLTASMFSQNDLVGYTGWATGAAIKSLFGNAGLMFITAGLAFAIFSGVNSFYMGAARVMSSMSEDGLLSKKFSLKHKKYGTPYQSILFILFIIMAAPFFGRQVLAWIVDMAALGGAIVFFYTALTAYRISSGIERIVGAFATVFSSIFILLLVIPGSPGFLSIQSIIALVLWSALGVVFFLLDKNNEKKQKTTLNKHVS
ncbi:APC family permease [Bacillus sp. HMF5848]|uniref:APC family permease n=1 Tax=Bacillus sp. HMF5848 TaxID=2495421 RepID=UPI000F7835D7|nr:APC family permease [Bacillus sp. HMF5848]RSK25723.1 APC family permease [Bacillus sp. HMF5848]